MNDILRLQKALLREGLNPGPLDGKRGPRTQAALDAWLTIVKGLPWGPDVSRWNPLRNWQAVKEGGASFAYCKATHGRSKDPAFIKNWVEIREAGLYRGAYHWLSPEINLELQADAVFSAVGVLQPGDLPVAIDCERDGLGVDGLPGTADDVRATDDMFHRFARLVEERTGRAPMGYSYSYYLTDRRVASHGLPLWIADYRSGPPTLPDDWPGYAFHQFIGDAGRCPGVQGPCDLSRFNGGLEGLQRMAGLWA